MTEEFKDKLIEKLLEKIDIQGLIEVIGYEKLTDIIAEKAAELIVEKECPNAPTTPYIPWVPPFDPNNPIAPVTVMYGVTPIEYKPGCLSDITITNNSNSSIASTKKDK